MSPQWLLIPPAALLLAALAIVFWARRGRRVDDHPLCRKCRFDLFGKPEDSTRCPECGRDVTHARAICIGNRQPRRRVLAAATPFIVLPCLWSGLLAYAAFSGLNWNRHKPVTWLIREAQGADVPVRDRAFAELLRRTEENLLSADQIVDVSSAALAHQADVNQPWLVAWGNLVERLHQKGRLPADVWPSYARQALAASLKLWNRTYVRRGESMVVQIRHDPPRLSAASFWVSWTQGDRHPDEYSGHPDGRNDKHAADRLDGFHWPDPQRPVHSCGLFTPSEEVQAKLADGWQTVAVSLHVKMCDASATGPQVLDEVLRVRGDWELRPKTDPPVRLVKDEKTRLAVLKSLSNVSVMARAWPKTEEITVRAAFGPRPVPLCMLPVLRSGNQEWSGSPTQEKIRPLTADRGGVQELTIRIDGLLPDEVDVVLRPLPDHAKNIWSLWEIWGEEIVVPKIKVQRIKAGG